MIHKMSYAGQWLVCAVCDGHCWDDYSAVDCRMTVVLAVELMHCTYRLLIYHVDLSTATGSGNNSHHFAGGGGLCTCDVILEGGLEICNEM